MSSESEFLKFFLQHQRELMAYVSAAIRDTHAQNDIMQQTALILWRTFDQYNRTRPFTAWLISSPSSTRRAASPAG